MSLKDQEKQFEKVRSSNRLSWLLDSSIPLPGGFRIGLDGLLGLIPGVGDAIGGSLSTWILYQAYKLGVPKVVLIRMVINILIDAAIGAIPFLGDLFDFFWKANLKNAVLLENYRHSPVQTTRRSAASTAIFFVGVVVIAFAVVYTVIALLTLIWRAAFQGQ